MAEKQTPAPTPVDAAQLLREAYAALARRHADVAQQAAIHGDAGTRELAARLAGRLEGLQLAADILGVQLPEIDHAP